jgi:hypothetical protein
VVKFICGKKKFMKVSAIGKQVKRVPANAVSRDMLLILEFSRQFSKSGFIVLVTTGIAFKLHKEPCQGFTTQQVEA